MKRINEFRAPKHKRPKLQQSLKSMFLRTEPQFVEAHGVQLMCRYCQRKFLAPQGLAAHIHMHERAGDYSLPLKRKKLVTTEKQDDNSLVA